MTTPKIAFLGTPGFVVPILDAVAALGEVKVVVTRPDAPRGRSGTPGPSPVKQAAVERSHPVITPASSRELTEELGRLLSVDLAVVVAYGLIIPAEALALPAHGFLNLHYSVLPRWRGAAPVARAILAGDERSGVSLMQLDPGLDTGPILGVWSTRFGSEETRGEAIDRFTRMGERLLADLVPAYLRGGLVGVRQPDEGVTYAPKVDAEERRLDLAGAPEILVRTVRALSPSPGAYARLEDQPFKVLRARLASPRLSQGELVVADDGLLCGVGGGSIELVEVQPAGKRAMTGLEWARGRRGDLGRLE